MVGRMCDVTCSACSEICLWKVAVHGIHLSNTVKLLIDVKCTNISTSIFSESSHVHYITLESIMAKSTCPSLSAVQDQSRAALSSHDWNVQSAVDYLCSWTPIVLCGPVVVKKFCVMKHLQMDACCVCVVQKIAESLQCIVGPGNLSVLYMCREVDHMHQWELSK